MKQILFMMIAAMILLAPVMAQEAAAEPQTKCPYLAAKAAAGESIDKEMAAGCPHAGKTADGKTCCAAGKTADGKACCAAGKAAMAKSGETKDGAKAGCCAGKTMTKCPVTGMTKTSEAVAQTKCPVMGEKINNKYFFDYDGKRIYVCCPGCIDKIKADPEKYINAMEKDGIELEKVTS